VSKSVENRPSTKADSYSSGHVILCRVCNQKAYYCVLNSAPLSPS